MTSVGTVKVFFESLIDLVEHVTRNLFSHGLNVLRNFAWRVKYSQIYKDIESFLSEKRINKRTSKLNSPNLPAKYYAWIQLKM